MRIKYTKDVMLDNGSIVLWSQREEDGDPKSVPVRCGGCGKVRMVSASKASQKGYRGLCRKCVGFERVDIPKAELRRLYEKEEMSLAQVAKTFGCDPVTVWNRMGEYGIKTRSFAEAQIIRWGHKDQRRGFGGDETEKAKLMGFVKGDCTVEKPNKNGRTIRINCHTSDPEQIWLFKKLFEPYGYVSVGKPDEEGRVILRAYLNLSFSFLLDLKDEVPEVALRDEENFFGFVGGYTDAEGDVGVYGGQATFRLQSYDVNLLHQMHERLMELGIRFPKPRIGMPKGSITTGPGGKRLRCNQDLWYLKTKRKASLIELFARIKPYMQHPKRIRGMEACIKSMLKK